MLTISPLKHVIFIACCCCLGSYHNSFTAKFFHNKEKVLLTLRENISSLKEDFDTS